MKTYGEMDVAIYIFFTLVLVGGVPASLLQGKETVEPIG
jgi:hypothetical protein